MGEQVLHRVFEGWARRQPTALAVSGGGERLTYRELETRARLLAAELVAAGLARGRPVVVLAGRGPHLVAAQFGTLLAGGAFVCVDPRHPWSRLRQVVDGAAPGALLVDDDAWARHREQVRAAYPDLPVVRAAIPSGGSRPAPPVQVGPDDLAYIAFTSGSTGRPKDIPHHHATLSQFVAWQGEAFGIEPGARVAQLAPPGFDVSYCETFGALCRGASLHVVPEAARGDAGQLAAWLRAERVTLLQIVPAHWRVLLAELPDRDRAPFPDLRTVLFVGEALAPGLVAETRARLRPAPRLVNVYGPTEVVAATFHEVGEVDGGLRSVPVGRPIPGREIVLDGAEGGDEDGDGVGEICIRSPYLTASAGDVYRTGDLARRLPGGELLFVGRVDNQVKVRGQRVELEDVEAAVVATGAASEAVAAVRTGPDDSQALVAFVVPADPARFDAAWLRRRLADALPPYMVPSALVAVDTLPRNANGKVDRRAVRDWDVPTDHTASDTPDEPEGETERAIADIWCELLGLDRVGRHDDLFALGGDSLLATRLISRIRSRLGARVTLGTFFEDPTVAGVAAAASSAPARSGPALRRQTA
jgi:acyl-coenzyme A synthetase/AMP-(fatty) acid ligase